METKSLLTSRYRVEAANRFIDSIDSEQYYFYVGNHLNPNNVVTPIDNTRDTTLNTYYGMIFGKKINTTDACLMIKRHDYQSNTVYTMYDHANANLNDSNYYAIVHDGAQYDVFKCLDNNNGAASQVAPSRSNVSIDNDDFYYPTDGYRWKYMYSVTDAKADKFSSPDYFPVVQDAGVKSKAQAGALDMIKVRTAGKGYNNYLFGQFGVGDIRLNGDPKKYALATSSASHANGFYDACWLYISGGPGAGQYRKIQSYTSNTTYNTIILANAFDSSDTPENTSTFEIFPSVRITGDGNETIEADARAVVNVSSNTISHIEMLKKGRDYNIAGASVVYSASVGVTEVAQLSTIYSPTNGHGYDAASELCAHYVGVGVKLNGTESNTVITSNDYSQWGIIKNPEFRNVALQLSGLNIQFSTNEFVYKIDPVRLYGLGSTVKNSNNVLTSQLNVQGINPNKIVKANDTLLLSFSNNYMLANVYSVSNTSIVLDKTLTFDTNNAYSTEIYLANPSAKSRVNGYSTNAVELTNVPAPFAIGDVIVGSETGTHGTVSSVSISGVTKGFSTFMQTSIYVGSISQGTFIPDETVYQVANSAIRARFHSVAPDQATGTSRFYMTHQIGVFDTSTDGALNDEIIGNTSGAIAELTNKYLPDLVFGSGEVMYIENFPPITREDEKTETFKIVLAF